MNRYGILDFTIVEGTTNGDIFLTYFLTSLAHCMNEYPNDNSVLVLDNARIHRMRVFKVVSQYLGIHVCYLSSYSPHLMPCEHFFCCLKQFMLRNGELFRTNTVEMLILVHLLYRDFDVYGCMEEAGYFDFLNH